MCPSDSPFFKKIADRARRGRVADEAGGENSGALGARIGHDVRGKGDGCLWATPWLIARFGLRVLFLSGVVAWTLRYALLAVGSYADVAPPVYAAILFHGPCYVFVYVIGVMSVDRLAGRAHRGAAQGLYALASAGLGHLIGALSVGMAQATFLTPAGVSPAPYHWTAFWIVPASFSLAAVIMFNGAFRRPQRQLEIEAVAP